MENPHEQQQSAILKRIVANIGKLNKTVGEVNNKFESINKKNENVANLADMWTAYGESVRIHLESEANKKNEPRQ